MSYLAAHPIPSSIADQASYLEQLNGLRPDLVASLTEEDIKSLRTGLPPLKRRMALRGRWFYAWSIFGAALLVVGFFTIFALLIQGKLAGVLLVIPIVAMYWLFTHIAWRSRAYVDNAEIADKLMHWTEPMSSVAGSCEEALRMVRDHKECRQYRDTAIASGRELCLWDLNCLLDLMMAARNAEVRVKAEESCRELHFAMGEKADAAANLK